MRDRRYFAAIPIVALLAILPLMLKGNSCGHDFDFHLFNWLEAGSQWRQGVLFPHWVFTTAWNSGEPRFIFYPPLSWTAGALLGLMLPWAAVPNTFIWLALTASGLTSYRLARQWTEERNALIVACVYMIHPYMLFTLYERSAYAELLAAAWMPLLLSAILRPRLTIPSIALPVALLWLTNDPAAVMGCYTLALLGVLRIAWMLRDRCGLEGIFAEAGRIIAGTALGMALAGFYLLPAIYEQRWVQLRMAIVEGVRIQDNFLFGQFGGPSHRAILRTASLCSVTLLILLGAFAIAALVETRRDGNEAVNRRRAGISLVVLGLVIAFLLTAPSAFLWRHAPELKFLQFPWRFDCILGCGAVALLAMALHRARPAYSVVVAIVLAAPLLLSFAGYTLFHQSCNRSNSVASIVSDFNNGVVADPADEYTPRGADPFAISHANPNAWVAASASDPAPATGMLRRNSVSLADRLHFEVASTGPAFLVVNLRSYPAWRVAVNGVNVASYPHRADGLIALPIPAGKSKVDITYALTVDRTLGWALSGLAFCGLLCGLTVSHRRSSLPISQRV